MLDKDVENLRSAVKNNYINYKQLYEFLFEKAGEFKSPGGAILQIGDHLRWHPAGNPEINFIHMVFDMMWKKII
jgi:hypothetical protein